jgi:hypothetical protein
MMKTHATSLEVGRVVLKWSLNRAALFVRMQKSEKNISCVFLCVTGMMWVNWTLDDDFWFALIRIG